VPSFCAGIMDVLFCSYTFLVFSPFVSLTRFCFLISKGTCAQLLPSCIQTLTYFGYCILGMRKKKCEANVSIARTNMESLVSLLIKKEVHRGCEGRVLSHTGLPDSDRHKDWQNPKLAHRPPRACARSILQGHWSKSVFTLTDVTFVTNPWSQGLLSQISEYPSLFLSLKSSLTR
jgi:hypothetical protein